MRDPRLYLFENSTPHGSQNDGVSMGVGLGKPHDDGNHLYNIKINDYQASDANFVGDGEESATSQTNIPAILAARQAGGYADPKTIHNGINKRFSLNPGPSLSESHYLNEISDELARKSMLYRTADVVDHGAQAIQNFRKGNLRVASKEKKEAIAAGKKLGRNIDLNWKRTMRQGPQMINQMAGRMSHKGRNATMEIGSDVKNYIGQAKDKLNQFKKL